MNAHEKTPPGGDVQDREELRLQQQADAADVGPTPAAAVCQYRLIAQAVRTARMPAIPSGFAAQVAHAAAEAAPAGRGTTRWAGLALLGVLLVHGVATAWSALAPRWTGLLDGPWPVLIASGAAIALSSLLDRSRGGRSGAGGGWR